MIPNPPTPEEQALNKLSKELGGVYAEIDAIKKREFRFVFTAFIVGIVIGFLL